MNTCILMAEVIANPELRKTTDDLDVANMMVEFPGLKEEEPTARIRVVGWGKIGIEISENYKIGDRVVIEGRLSMNVIEKEGSKEKRAELVVSHIYSMGQSGETKDFTIAQPTNTPTNVVNLQPSSSSKPEVTTPAPEYAYSATSTTSEDATEEYDEGTLDEIPFLRPVYAKTLIGKELCDSWELAANCYWEGIK
jgi:single-strand DNA-binding protein